MRIASVEGLRGGPATTPGTRGVHVTRLARGADFQVVRLALDPGGIVGRHAAAVDQLFVVVSGAGWVAGADGRRHAVAAEAAVFWDEGEEHESGTDEGMEAIVVEAAGVELGPER